MRYSSTIGLKVQGQIRRFSEPPRPKGGASQRKDHFRGLAAPYNPR